MGRADGRGVLMGCHEPLAGVLGRCTRLAGSGLVRTGHAGGHFGMLQAFAMDGLAGCDVVAGLSPAARNAVGPWGDALRRAMHVRGSRDVGGTGGQGLR